MNYHLETMSVTVSQQISRYYDYYRDKEIVFTKETLHYLRIDPRQIYIKCGGGQWPCIINSTSFLFAKVIIGTSSGVYAQLTKKAELPISVRYCFIEADNSPLSFFINGKVTEVVPFKGSSELVVVTITFTQRPPDDLLFRLGQFIDTNENFARRKEERVIINAETLRKLSLDREETILTVANVPRRCVLRDLSFGGAKVMCMGIPKFLTDKEASIRLTFSEPQAIVNIPGVIRKAESLEGRKDIVVANIEFDEAQVPMVYKLQINDFITNNKKTLLEMNKLQQQQAQAARAAQIQAQQAAQAQAQAEAAKAQTEQPQADSAAAQPEAAAPAAETQPVAAPTASPSENA